jgi:hypothetical protein
LVSQFFTKLMRCLTGKLLSGGFCLTSLIGGRSSADD